MELGTLDLGMVATGAATLGAVVTEAIRRLFPSRDRVLEDGAAIRGELWDQLQEMQREIRSLRGEVDSWQAKYFALERAHDAVQASHARLESDHVALRLELDVLRGHFAGAEP